MIRRIKNTAFGFTLIELLVVISIISALSSIVFASLQEARVSARDAKRLSDIKQIMTALELYYDQNGFYPLCSANNVCSTNGYAGPMSTLPITAYLSVIPNDPVNTSTLYGYYYARGYYASGVSTFVLTGSASHYIIATRLEKGNGPVFAGWNNFNLNYLRGVGP